jgi:hypothetical protein
MPFYPWMGAETAAGILRPQYFAGISHFIWSFPSRMRRGEASRIERSL